MNLEVLIKIFLISAQRHHFKSLHISVGSQANLPVTLAIKTILLLSRHAQEVEDKIVHALKTSILDIYYFVAEVWGVIQAFQNKEYFFGLTNCFETDRAFSVQSPPTWTSTNPIHANRYWFIKLYLDKGSHRIKIPAIFKIRANL